ncbi:MAG TPA: PQQ-binding-like beta-propeller repeat protein [Pyrinomonadaceae bacterium]|nr:PQQ-binding-like beta-propeller repeat protein [Pyrinomonadaceae bacterium]
MDIRRKNGRSAFLDAGERVSTCRIFLSLGLFFLFLASALPAASQEGRLSLSKPLKIRWKYKTASTVNLTPAFDKGNVYLPLSAGDVVSLRSVDGELNWKTETGGDISASPVADDRGVYIASETTTEAAGAYSPRATGAIRALGNKSGVTLWMRTLQSPIRGVLASDGHAVYGGAADGRVYAIRKDTGQIVWVLEHSAPFLSHPVVSGNDLYIGSEDGTLFCINRETGQVRWRYRTRGSLRAPVAVVDQMVFVGSADRNVYAIRALDGRLRWRVRTGAAVQSVLPTLKGLVVTSLDNFVYALSPARGVRLWKRQLAGRVAGQPLAADDGALFAPLAGDECVVLDLRDGRKLNSLEVGEDNNTGASPIAVGSLLLVTTRQGLFAYGEWSETGTQGN